MLCAVTTANLFVYREDYKLPNHAGTVLPDGSMIAPPSRVNACLSDLAVPYWVSGNWQSGELGSCNQAWEPCGVQLTCLNTARGTRAGLALWLSGRVSCAYQQQQSVSASGPPRWLHHWQLL